MGFQSVSTRIGRYWQFLALLQSMTLALQLLAMRSTLEESQPLPLPQFTIHLLTAHYPVNVSQCHPTFTVHNCDHDRHRGAIAKIDDHLQFVPSAYYL